MPKRLARREMLKASASLGVAAVAGAVLGETAKAQECPPEKATYNARFCVMPTNTLRGVHTRSNEEVIAAQRAFLADKRSIDDLEELVKAARAGTLERVALSLAAVAW